MLAYRMLPVVIEAIFIGTTTAAECAGGQLSRRICGRINVLNAGIFARTVMIPRELNSFHDKAISYKKVALQILERKIFYLKTDRDYRIGVCDYRPLGI